MKINTRALEVIMAQKALSKSDVAKLANISSSTLTRAVNGAEVSPKTVGMLARGLEVDVDGILSI